METKEARELLRKIFKECESFKTRLESLKQLSQTMKEYPFRARILGFPLLVIDTKEELIGRIKELEDILNIYLIKEQKEDFYKYNKYNKDNKNSKDNKDDKEKNEIEENQSLKFYMVGAPGSGTTFFKRWLEKHFEKYIIIEQPIPFKMPDIASPHGTFYIPWTLKNYPKYKCIHIIRDGRDSIVSRIKRKHSVEGDEIIKTFLPHINYEDFKQYKKCVKYAHLWKKYIEKGIAERGKLNYLEVKYESICNETEKTLKKVCKFLNVPWKSEYLKDMEENLKPHIGGGAYLDSEEMDLVMKIIKPVLKKLNYL